MIDRHKIDVFEIEESFGFSKAVSDLNKIPVVVRLHGPWFINGQTHSKTKDSIDRQMREGLAIKAASFVTAPSLYVRQLTLDQYRMRAPSDRLNFAYLPNPIKAPSQQWGVEKCDANSLLFVGRFDKIKGGDVVLRAFGHLAEKNPALKLTFVGPDRGIEISGKNVSATAYAKSVLSPSALSRVEFKGALPRKEIKQLRLASFTTLFASRIEIFGYTVLEAMAAGCPIVASDAGGVAEMIENDTSGLLFHPGEDEAMADAIQLLIDNRDMAKRLGASARAKAMTFSVDNVANHTVDYYRQAIRYLTETRLGVLRT